MWYHASGVSSADDVISGEDKDKPNLRPVLSHKDHIQFRSPDKLPYPYLLDWSRSQVTLPYQSNTNRSTADPDSLSMDLIQADQEFTKHKPGVMASDRGGKDKSGQNMTTKDAIRKQNKVLTGTIPFVTDMSSDSGKVTMSTIFVRGQQTCPIPSGLRQNKLLIPRSRINARNTESNVKHVCQFLPGLQKSNIEQNITNHKPTKIRFGKTTEIPIDYNHYCAKDDKRMTKSTVNFVMQEDIFNMWKTNLVLSKYHQPLDISCILPQYLESVKPSNGNVDQHSQPWWFGSTSGLDIIDHIQDSSHSILDILPGLDCTRDHREDNHSDSAKAEELYDGREIPCPYMFRMSDLLPGLLSMTEEDNRPTEIDEMTVTKYEISK